MTIIVYSREFTAWILICRVLSELFINHCQEDNSWFNLGNSTEVWSKTGNKPYCKNKFDWTMVCHWNADLVSEQRVKRGHTFSPNLSLVCSWESALLLLCPSFLCHIKCKSRLRVMSDIWYWTYNIHPSKKSKFFLLSLLLNQSVSIYPPSFIHIYFYLLSDWVCK